MIEHIISKFIDINTGEVIKLKNLKHYTIIKTIKNEKFYEFRNKKHNTKTFLYECTRKQTELQFSNRVH